MIDDEISCRQSLEEKETSWKKIHMKDAHICMRIYFSEKEIHVVYFWISILVIIGKKALGKCWFKNSMVGTDFLSDCTWAILQSHKVFNTRAWGKVENMFRRDWMNVLYSYYDNFLWCFHLRHHFWYSNASIR